MFSELLTSPGHWGSNGYLTFHTRAFWLLCTKEVRFFYLGIGHLNEKHNTQMVHISQFNSYIDCTDHLSIEFSCWSEFFCFCLPALWCLDRLYFGAQLRQCKQNSECRDDLHAKKSASSYSFLCLRFPFQNSRGTLVWTTGCITAIYNWLQANWLTITIACAATILLQVRRLCCRIQLDRLWPNLISFIKLQHSLLYVDECPSEATREKAAAFWACCATSMRKLGKNFQWCVLWCRVSLCVRMNLSSLSRIENFAWQALECVNSCVSAPSILPLPGVTGLPESFARLPWWWRF